MNILIIYAHPSKKSYTYTILEQLHAELKKENHTVEISDLYAMDFRSDMSEQEYDREGLGNHALPLSSDVQEEHNKIEKADCLIFLYPVWWSDCPAKLKGWFDRVFSAGYAYGYDAEGNKTRKMKTLKSGHAICTAGYTQEYLDKTGIGQSMKTVMLDDRLGNRCAHKAMTILGGTLNKEQTKRGHAEKIIALAGQLKNYNI